MNRPTEHAHPAAVLAVWVACLAFCAVTWAAILSPLLR